MEPNRYTPLPTKTVTEDPFLTDILLQECFIDRNRPRSLNEAMRRGLVPARYMAQARAILEALDRAWVRKPKWALPARSLYNDPGWDNVLRAYEEDR